MLRLSRSLSRFETQDIMTQPQFNHYKVEILFSRQHFHGSSNGSSREPDNRNEEEEEKEIIMNSKEDGSELFGKKCLGLVRNILWRDTRRLSGNVSRIQRNSRENS